MHYYASVNGTKLLPTASSDKLHFRNIDNKLLYNQW